MNSNTENSASHNKTEKDVLDGEVISGESSQDPSRDSSSAKEKSSNTFFKRDDKSTADSNGNDAKSGRKVPPKSPRLKTTSSPTPKKLVFALSGLLLLNAVTLVSLMSTQGSVNELRNDLNQIQAKQGVIAKTQAEMQPQLTTLEKLPEDTVSTQALNTSLEELRKQIQQTSNSVELDQLKANQQALIDQIDNLSVSATGGSKPDMSAYESRLQEMQAHLDKLQLQQSASTASTAYLSAKTIQQWVLELNTDWLMGASAEQTRKKLIALEKAIMNSDLSASLELARMIGQDLAYLKQWQAQKTAVFPSMQPLRNAVRQLDAPTVQESLQQKPVSADSLSTGEVIEQDSAWQRLKERLSALVTIKNRAESNESTTVEALLKHDIQKQRLLLLLDRMQWASKHDSAQGYQDSIQAIEVFIKQNFAHSKTDFVQLLQPFTTYKPSSRDALVVSTFPFNS